VWQAQYVALVAPLLNMTEEQVLWDLPLCRGLAYWHQALLLAGNTMEFPGESDEDAGIFGARKLLALYRERQGR
jgi:hypothetical protein